MNLLAKAIRIASIAFEHKIDKSGKPYILHCLWVMDRVRHLGESYMIVAILHDLLEDTDWTPQMLRDEGFPSYIVDALQMLDFRNCDYIERIGTIAHLAQYDNLDAKLAAQIKLRDLEHNSKITRLKGIEDSDIERIKKYHISYKILEDLRR